MNTAIKRAAAMGLGPLIAVAFGVSCGDGEDCAANRTCGATAGSSAAGSAGKSGSGGTDAGGSNGGSSSTAGSSSTSGSAGVMGGGGEGGGGGTACTGDVSDDAACWTTNDLGVFVSSDTGDDTTGNGTKEMPFKTITKGIASASGKNVYVCVGAADYSEKISLDLASDGIHIYGGFECSGWTYATTRSAQVLSPSNIALRIDGLKKGAHIENVSFKAADATGAGTDASSYGAFVTGSKGVELTRVELTAGDGANGSDGEDGAKGADGTAAGSAPVGKAGTCTAAPLNLAGGSWDAENSCGSAGGKGGDAGRAVGGAGLGGTPTEHVTQVEQETGEGGPAATDATAGKNGSNGMSGDAGVAGTAAPEGGIFASAGFAVADGKVGGSGFPGQGGGGGGASKGRLDANTCVGASGGAGGMGGCGGLAGGAGGGGGASVGLFSWSSSISLLACTVKSAAGGDGGAGGKGGQRGLGAPGGTGGGQDPDTLVALGGNGGRGGNGGPGGNGSGGTGGPSYALVYSGTKPVYDAGDTTLTAGTPGAAGVGGQQVSTTQAPNGSVGQSAQEFPVP
jgi:hypothetical protein